MNVTAPNATPLTFSPAHMGDIPPKGTLDVPISHRMRAKVYILAARRSTSSGLFCNPIMKREGKEGN